MYDFYYVVFKNGLFEVPHSRRMILALYAIIQKYVEPEHETHGVRHY